MTRHLQVTRLRPEAREEYFRLHQEVWPEVQERLVASGIRDYTIFLQGDLLIGTFDHVGDDFDADMRAMAADAATQRWWALTEPCQEPLPEARAAGTTWADAVEVWHLP